MLSRRGLLTTAALGTGAFVAPVSVLGSADAAVSTLRLRTYIGGAEVSRNRVLLWEAGRIRVASKRLQGYTAGALLGELDVLINRPAGSTAHVARDRQRLADLKMDLGETKMRSVTAADLLASNPISLLGSSMGQWKISRATVTSNKGTAQGMKRWFDHHMNHNNVRSMLVACPDHYLLRTPERGSQDVIEVTGGAMLASHFVIKYGDTTGLPIPADPRSPVRASGWARQSGQKIGGVRHQLRNMTGGGFRGDFAVAFPAALPDFMIAEHRWHLACEWSNWMTAYAKTIS